MIHWADGGSTSVSNGVCLCQGCHTRVHEGGYSIQSVDGNKHRLEEQFEQHQRTDDLSLFTVEKELRNNRASFTRVHRLLPTRYRFRIVDAVGTDIRNSSPIHACSGEAHISSTPTHSTRVEYVKPMSDGCGDGKDDAASHIGEYPSFYRVDTGKYQVIARGDGERDSDNRYRFIFTSDFRTMLIARHSLLFGAMTPVQGMFPVTQPDVQ